MTAPKLPERIVELLDEYGFQREADGAGLGTGQTGESKQARAHLEAELWDWKNETEAPRPSTADLDWKDQHGRRP